MTAIISQNGNAYEEGLGEVWSPIKAYWKEQTPQRREAVRALLTPAAVRDQYVHGAPDPGAVAPEGYTLDSALLARPGNADIQLDLFLDYRTNVASYPRWQVWLREHQPKLLVMWGRYDPSFIVPGAEGYKRDVPNAELHILDAGHFALDEATDEIARLTRDFLGRSIETSTTPPYSPR